MPKERPIHMNPPDDAEFTSCGRLLRRVKWDTSPERVTCKHCKRVLHPAESPYSESMAFEAKP